MMSLRQVFRSLRKSPGYALTVVITLALGVGACSALFSVVNSMLYRRTPIAELDRLVFTVARKEGDPTLCSPAEFEAWRDGARSFESWGAAVADTGVLSALDEPEQLDVALVDSGYFSTLGVSAVLGRAFTDEELSSRAPVILLGHEFWVSRFGGDATVLGRSLTLDGTPREVIGVLPRGFDLPRRSQVYRPYLLPAPGTPDRPGRGLFIVGRLAEGASLGRADTEIKALSAQLAADEPETQKGWTANLIPLRRQFLLDINGELDRRLLLLGGAVGMLLLIACLNVGNLVLARSLGRSREFAVCAALGADSRQIAARVFAESAVLAGFGGVLGLMFAQWITPILAAASPVETVALSSVLMRPVIDMRVIGLTVLLVILAMLLGGLPAMWNATRLDLNEAIHAGGARGSSRAGGRWRHALVVAEVAICVSLLAAAALLGKSFQRIVEEPLGFDPRGVLALRVAPSPERYPDQASRVRFAERVLEQVRALPGVTEAGIGNTLPLHLDGWTAAYRPETGPYSTAELTSATTHRTVTAGYLEAMRMTLVRGRFIEGSDTADAPAVAVISQTFADRMWPGVDAIGKRVFRPRQPERMITVVGIVAPVKEDRVLGVRSDGPVWYVPYSQHNFVDAVHIVVRSDGDPSLLSRAVAAAVHEVDPLQPVYEIEKLEPYVAAFLAPERFAASLLGAFALLGLLLAALGIYGVSAYFVRLREREFGVRIALGATPSGVWRLVVGRSLRLLVIGLAIGFAGSVLLGFTFASVLFGVSPLDVGIHAGVVAALAIVAVLASILPACRASRIDPRDALRAE